ncbi:MAG: hypothetical protein QOD77_1602 [Thermoplasmata archaeon]|jgi:hypothetical protein|nr:hypothetical protein [Thermoplasmata archaeon]
MKTRAPILLAALVLAAALAKGQITHSVVAPVPSVGTDAGFAPLTPVERLLAVQVAQGDPNIQNLLAPFRHVTIGASLALPAVKVEPLAAVLRAAEVQFYRYDVHDTLTARVDLSALRVADFQTEVREPVMVVEELQAAKPVLLADSRVSSYAGDLNDLELINAGAVQTIGTPCEFSRCFETRFVHNSGANMVDLQPIEGLHARFNLSAMAVDDVWYG